MSPRNFDNVYQIENSSNSFTVYKVFVNVLVRKGEKTLILSSCRVNINMS